jgi:hypothetical protein
MTGDQFLIFLGFIAALNLVVIILAGWIRKWRDMR